MMNILKKICLMLVLVLFTGAMSSLIAASSDKQKGENEADTANVKKENKYEKITQNSQKTAKGLMNLYSQKDKLYLEIPFDLLEREMLLGSTVSEISDNNHSVVGSKPYAPIMVQFTRVDSSLQLRKLTANKIAPSSDENIISALEKNSIGSIMEVFKIEAYNENRTTGIIEISNFLLKDIKELSPFAGVPGGYTRSESFKKDRSFIGELKSFDDNVSIKSHLTYEYTLKRGKTTYAKNEAFTAVMTRTFLLLPEEPTRPRIADPRIGIFVSGKNFLSNDDNRTKAIYYAHRFNLVPSDIEAYKNGKLVEPVQPIVFYVDSDFPATWKESVKNAINDWNKTFEKIGFKNAVKALDYPKNDSAFDPDNLKYNCVRYAPAPVANAMGPSWVDPRSGEIINASVYVFHDIVKLLNNWMFIQTSPADKNVRNVKLPDDYMKKAIRYVIRHEVGHCLGFMHNMGSSYVIPVDSLRSPSFTQKYGTTYSIMDYARFNYVAQPGDKEKGVRLSPPEFGLYDYYMVKWNYTYFPEVKDELEESELLKNIINEKADDPVYRYGKQQGNIIDPSSQSEDLGDDAVLASKYGIKNLKFIMKNLNTWLAGEDKDYSYRREIWAGIVNQYLRYINHVYGNVGGIYLNEKYEGDPLPFYESVSRKKQEEALQFLFDEIKDLEWLESPDVIQNMTLMGTPVNFLREKIVEAALQSTLKVNLSALKSKESNPYTPEECMKDIYANVWAESGKGEALTPAEMDIQKAFVKSVIVGSKLADIKKSGAKSFYSMAEHGIPLPAFLENELIDTYGVQGYQEFINPQQTNIDLVSGFQSISINFNLAPNLESMFYNTLLDTRDLLKKSLKKCKDEETKNHYQLLLHQIEKTIK